VPTLRIAAAGSMNSSAKVPSRVPSPAAIANRREQGGVGLLDIPEVAALAGCPLDGDVFALMSHQFRLPAMSRSETGLEVQLAGWGWRQALTPVVNAKRKPEVNSAPVCGWTAVKLTSRRRLSLPPGPAFLGDLDPADVSFRRPLGECCLLASSVDRHRDEA